MIQKSTDHTLPKPAFRQWLPVICMAFATFIFNTTEFIPIGLLSSIAGNFNMTETGAGIMITVYAWAVALLSLPLMLIFARTESKKLLGLVFCVFVASNALSYLSNSFYMLMASRLGVACAHSVFWAIAPPLAVRIAPPGKQSAALSILTVGSSLAMILGLPIGRTIGLYLGWRVTFLSIAVTAFVIMLLLMKDLPTMPSRNTKTAESLPHIFRNKALMSVYLLTVLTITGHFCGYSYIEPFLTYVIHLSKNVTTLALLVFGFTGILGSLLFTRFSIRWSVPFAFWSVGGIMVSLLALKVFSFNQTGIFCVIMVWGVAISIFNLSYQYRIISLSPNNTDIAMAIYSAIYNIGIGGGAFIGGIVSHKAGVGNIGLIGFAIVAVGFIYGMVYVKPLLLKAAAKKQDSSKH